MLIDRIPCARLLILLLVLPAPLLAAPVTQDEATLWDTTRDGAEHAIDWTVEKSSQGWEATREGAGKAVDWTTKTSSQGWEAVRESASRGVEWVKEKTAKPNAPAAAQH